MVQKILVINGVGMYIENIQSNNMINYIVSKYDNAIIEDNNIIKYTDIEEEYMSLKYGAGIYINPNPIIIGLEGSDVLDYLHRVSTNSIKNLQTGKVVNTLFLNEKGRFIDRTILLNLENKYLLIGQNNLDWLLNWINKFIITEDIKTSTLTNLALITITGPQSESFLTVILGNELQSINEDNFIQTNIDGFNFIIFSQTEKGNIKQFKLIIEKENLNSFTEYLVNNKSVFDVHLIGEIAYNLYRINNGIPGRNEISHLYNPHEVGLLNEVSFTKGCYIGQEVIARLDSYDKVQRKMFRFLCSEQIYPNDILRLFNQNNEEIGDITSFAFSEKDKKTIGLALVRIKTLNENSQYYILNGDKKLNVEKLEAV